FNSLKKGGILLFSTFSILKDENIRQAEAFLKRHPDASYLPFDFKGNLVETYQRLPGEDDADGFFYTRFIKN
ncbi:MAG: 16S rRNA (cytosine(967)-C(5))-methyltransferase, partial [Succinivibrio sp.]|nr:16S rRNA (cytosine(967)-C(5))-methyltransferase [Succinivibrio sp.]